MGVFGEKHTSLTREQKRQLIHQADTHKLRPTEVCDWVLATWGLRIARVTVYSILHKQRASLMAGRKDMYQSMHCRTNSMQYSPESASSSSPSSTNCNLSSVDECLERDMSTGRVTKHRTNNKLVRSAYSSAYSNANSSSQSSGGVSDLSSTVNFNRFGEGARWEGQLKRVREPASVELDRAMIEFLKSSAAVDAHGRRINDAELQANALRLALGIPSASRMRCSFGWLRHFKRRLGVQWAPDQLGRHRWIIEMDPSRPIEGSSPDTQESSSSTPAPSLSSAEGTYLFVSSAETAPAPSLASSLMAASAYNSHPSRSLGLFRGQGKVMQVHDDHLKTAQLPSHPTPDGLVEDYEYYSSRELLRKDDDVTLSSVNAFTTSGKSARPTGTSTSTSISDSHSYRTPFPIGHQSEERRSLDMQQPRLQQPQQPQLHRYHSFRESSSFSSLGQFTSSVSRPLNVPTTSLAHPSQSSYLSPHNSSIQPSQPTTQSLQSSILDSFPSFFHSLHPLQNTPAAVSSSLLLLNNTSFRAFQADTTPDSSLSPDTKLSTSKLSMSVDGRMRKVPSTNEAYEMLQNLLLCHEQDHHYIGEQQTLLLPKWIHQRRQILNQSDDSDGKVMWMHQHNSSGTQQQQHHHQIRTAPPLVSSPESFSPHMCSLTSTQSYHHL